MSTAPVEDHKESDELSISLNQAPNREAGQGRQEWTLQEACGAMRPFTVSSYHTLHGHFSSVSIFCTCQGFHSTKASLKTITFRLLAGGQVTIQVHELQHASGEVTAQLY